MKPLRTIRYDPTQDGIVLRVKLNDKTLQAFLPKEEYKSLNSIDFEYLKECNYVLLETKLREMG